jgi:hypothetical protein
VPESRASKLLWQGIAERYDEPAAEPEPVIPEPEPVAAMETAAIEPANEVRAVKPEPPEAPPAPPIERMIETKTPRKGK